MPPPPPPPTLSTDPIQPRGPASSPSYLPSTHPSNPYDFTPPLLRAAHLPPKITASHVFFFGYEGSDPHVCLQQWFPAPFRGPRDPYASTSPGPGPGPGPVTDDAAVVDFPTAEHYMMYHKALVMGDAEVAAEILADPHPSAAKRLGRRVRNFDQDVWARHAARVAEEANWHKFSAEGNEDLKECLLGTRERVLVEASPDDRIWGIGFNSDDAEGNEAEWGDNGLGKALMKVRDRLRAAEA